MPQDLLNKRRIMPINQSEQKLKLVQNMNQVSILKNTSNLLSNSIVVGMELQIWSRSRISAQ